MSSPSSSSTSSSETRGTKRPSSDPASSSTSKRQGTDHGFVRSWVVRPIQKAFGYLFGSGASTADMDQDIRIVKDTNQRDINEEIVLVDDPPSVGTVQAAEPSTIGESCRQDEVQLVKIVNPSASDSDSSFERSRRTSKGSARKGFVISTKEKKDRDKFKYTPGQILKRVKEKNINVYRNNESELVGLKNPSFKDRYVDSPRRRTGIWESFRLDDKARYQKILSEYARSATVFAKSTESSSPFFKQPTSSRVGGISKVILDKKATQRKSEEIIRHVTSTPLVPSDPEVIQLDSDGDDPVIVAESDRLSERPKPKSPDADVIEIINTYASPRSASKNKDPDIEKKKLNSLEAEFGLCSAYSPDFLRDLRAKYDCHYRDRDRKIREEEVKLDYAREKNQRVAASIEERLKKHLSITEVDIEEEEEEEEEKLPDITEEMESVIQRAVTSHGETLVEAYKIPISRKDIDTLRGLNWLNDEVINFYMQMICSRSEKKAGDLPKVYAMNTFFYPKLMQSGHAALKRWTRKVDIFSFDLIVIPVHLGMHWCLSVVDFRKPGVYYYDSMGGDNHRCLQALLQYLKDEHIDKKKSPYDTSKFETKLMKDIPQQMNGSDCGMFTCKFAEYLSRDAKLSFTQGDMPYFRKRMIYEIVANNLIHP